MLKFSGYRIPVYLTKEETESVSAQLKNIIQQYKESIAELKEPSLVSAAEQSISYYEQLQLEFLKAIDEHLKINVKHSA